MVWTWDSCDNAQGRGIAGHWLGSGIQGSHPTCTPSHTPSAVRCCADSEWVGVELEVHHEDQTVADVIAGVGTLSVFFSLVGCYRFRGSILRRFQNALESSRSKSATPKSLKRAHVHHASDELEDEMQLEMSHDPLSGEFSMTEGRPDSRNFTAPYGHGASVDADTVPLTKSTASTQRNKAEESSALLGDLLPPDWKDTAPAQRDIVAPSEKWKHDADWRDTAPAKEGNVGPSQAWDLDDDRRRPTQRIPSHALHEFDDDDDDKTIGATTRL